jgi:hypothetical protein
MKITVIDDPTTLAMIDDHGYVQAIERTRKQLGHSDFHIRYSEINQRYQIHEWSKK